MYNSRIPLWNPDHKGNTLELSEPDPHDLCHEGNVTIKLKGWNPKYPIYKKSIQIIQSGD